MSASPRVQRLVTVLGEHPGSTLRELAALTAIAPRHLAMLLWRLEDDGRVAHEAHRWFAVDEE